MRKVFPCFIWGKSILFYYSRLVISFPCWSRLFDATLGPVSVSQKGGLSLAKVIHPRPSSSLSVSPFSLFPDTNTDVDADDDVDADYDVDADDNVDVDADNDVDADADYDVDVDADDDVDVDVDQEGER